MKDTIKLGAFVILAIMGIRGVFKFFEDISGEPIAYSNAYSAFIGSLGTPFQDAVAEELRTVIVEKCALVANRKLSAAASKQSFIQITQLLGGRDLTSDIVIQILTNATQRNPEISNEVECLSALTLMRREYPDLWNFVEMSSAGDGDLAAIGLYSTKLKSNIENLLLRTAFSFWNY